MGTCTLDNAHTEEATVEAGRLARRLRGALGDVSGCRAVRENGAVSVVHIGVHLGIVACVVVVLVTSRPGAWDVLDGLGLASTLLALYRVRHAMGLGLRLAWHAFEPRTRAVLALALAGFLAPYVLGYRALLPRVAVVALLLLTALTSAGTAVVLATADPAKAYVTALSAAAYRLADADAVARLKAELVA